MKAWGWAFGRSHCNFLKAFWRAFTGGKVAEQSSVYQVNAQSSGGLWRRKPGRRSASSLAVWGQAPSNMLICQSAKFLKSPGICGSPVTYIMWSKGPSASAIPGPDSGSRLVWWIPGRCGSVGVWPVKSRGIDAASLVFGSDTRAKPNLACLPTMVPIGCISCVVGLVQNGI